MTTVKIDLNIGDNKDQYVKEHIEEFINDMCSDLENAGLREVTYSVEVETI